MERIGVLAAPGVRVHDSQEETFVRSEVESDEHQRFSGVERDQVDRRLPETEARVNDPEARLDALDVLGNQLLQVAEIRDFQLLERRFHPCLPWRSGLFIPRLTRNTANPRPKAPSRA